MTDNEIIKALECCNNGWCDNRCPYYGREDIADCREQSGADQLDLINRQKAEIEKLTKDSNRLKKVEMQLDDMCKMYHIIKTEAVKEFAEALKNKAFKQSVYSYNDIVETTYTITAEEIDYLVKEMVGDNDASKT